MLTSAPSGRFTSTITPAIALESTSLADVGINIRYVEHAGNIQRAVAIMQTRGSGHDSAVRQVTMEAGRGMRIGDPPHTAHLLPNEGGMSGANPTTPRWGSSELESELVHLAHGRIGSPAPGSLIGV
ncbi:hypothetical protein ACWDWO_24405 [Actinopolymorpha singaporensis]